MQKITRPNAGSVIMCCFQTAMSRQTQPVSSNTDCRTFALTAEPMADTRHLLSQRVRIPYFLFVAVMLLTFFVTTLTSHLL